MYMYNQEYMMGIMYMLCYLFFRVPLKDCHANIDAFNRKSPNPRVSVDHWHTFTHIITTMYIH